MAEQDAAVAEQDAAQENTAISEQPQEVSAEASSEAPYQYTYKVEDAGPSMKRVSVEIPRERIDAKLAEQFKELRQQAHIPGFRVGRAPVKLIEKRFASDAKEHVRRALISESYEQAVEREKLEIFGEPQFDNPDAIKLPEKNEPFTYAFEVEVRPDITIPDLSSLKVKKARIAVTDENVEQAMTNLREQQGTLMPVEDRGVEPKDFLYADVHLKLGEEVISHQHDAQIVARPGRIAGVDVVDLDTQLAGLKPGEERTITTKVPDTHVSEKIRGQEVQIVFTLKDLKKLELAVIDQEYLSDLGFENEGELREALREQMVERLTYDVEQSMREQVNQFLLDHTTIDLPSRLTERQSDRVVARRAMDLTMRGMPADKVLANVEVLRGVAREDAARELKLFFILAKIANEQNTEVNEDELNGRIGMLAAQRGVRPEKLKHEMAKDGTLQTLYIQLREQKAVDKLLESVQIEEVELQPKPQE